MGKQFEGTVLALDLATVTGWAETDWRGEGGFQKVRSGTVRWASAGASSEVVFGACLKWMVQRMQAFPPRLVVYEAPNWQHMGGRTNKHTVTVLAGLPAIVEAVCNRCGVPVMQAETRRARIWLLGSNPPRKVAKHATVSMVKRLGYEPQTEDEADAIMVLLYALAQRDTEFSVRMDVRLMGGRGDG